MYLKWIIVCSLLLLAQVAKTQVIQIQDTVRICTGSTYKGIVFGRDSLLVRDTIEGAGADTLIAIWVQTLPVYLNIRDTTIVRGGDMFGQAIFDNTSINQFGMTYLGCDSNITWVVYFKQDDPDFSIYSDRLSWNFSLFPTPTDDHFALQLLPQSQRQVEDAIVEVSIFSMLGREYARIEPEPIKNWLATGEMRKKEIITQDWPAGLYWVQLKIGRQVFTNGVVVVRN